MENKYLLKLASWFHKSQYDKDVDLYDQHLAYDAEKKIAKRVGQAPDPKSRDQITNGGASRQLGSMALMGGLGLAAGRFVGGRVATKLTGMNKAEIAASKMRPLLNLNNGKVDIQAMHHMNKGMAADVVHQSTKGIVGAAGAAGGAVYGARSSQKAQIDETYKKYGINKKLMQKK